MAQMSTMSTPHLSSSSWDQLLSQAFPSNGEGRGQVGASEYQEEIMGWPIHEEGFIPLF